jgi:hypothetical protein
MRESPFQITPSQSKMNVSTESTRGFLSSSSSLVAIAAEAARAATRGRAVARAREDTRAPRTLEECFAETRTAAAEDAATAKDIDANDEA